MSKVRILLVDDDPGITGLLHAMLPKAGYEVCEENRPFAAVSTARQFRPQLILLDVDMPGKDGGRVAAEIEADPVLAGTPIIFVTSLLRSGESGLCGTERFLAKPTDPAALLAAVQQALPQMAA